MYLLLEEFLVAIFKLCNCIKKGEGELNTKVAHIDIISLLLLFSYTYFDIYIVMLLLFPSSAIASNIKVIYKLYFF